MTVVTGAESLKQTAGIATKSSTKGQGQAAVSPATTSKISARGKSAGKKQTGASSTTTLRPVVVIPSLSKGKGTQSVAVPRTSSKGKEKDSAPVAPLSSAISKRPVRNSKKRNIVIEIPTSGDDESSDPGSIFEYEEREENEREMEVGAVSKAAKDSQGMISSYQLYMLFKSPA